MPEITALTSWVFCSLLNFDKTAILNSLSGSIPCLWIWLLENCHFLFVILYDWLFMFNESISSYICCHIWSSKQCSYLDKALFTLILTAQQAGSYGPSFCFPGDGNIVQVFVRSHPHWLASNIGRAHTEDNRSKGWWQSRGKCLGLWVCLWHVRRILRCRVTIGP